MLSLILTKFFYKHRSKFNIKKTLCPDDFVCLCQSIITFAREGNYTDEHLIGLSNIGLFKLNNLDKPLSDNILQECCIATILGWNSADNILRMMAENGGAWSEKYFDINFTSAYMSMMRKSNKVTELVDLAVLRWSFRHGERLRVQYHTIPEFIEGFAKGKLYDIKINLFEEI